MLAGLGIWFLEIAQLVRNQCEEVEAAFKQPGLRIAVSLGRSVGCRDWRKYKVLQLNNKLHVYSHGLRSPQSAGR